MYKIHYVHLIVPKLAEKHYGHLSHTSEKTFCEIVRHLPMFRGEFLRTLSEVDI